MIVNCDYCTREAKLVTGEVIYPHRSDLYNRNFWYCQHCNAYVGCHKGTDKPLGRLANEELRQWKKRAHLVFDPIWKQGHVSRKEAYCILAEELSIPYEQCHIGMFDVEMCRKAVTVMPDIKRKLGAHLKYVTMEG